mmetsp:Transcript_148395/g.269611  ORF Transcript_148395/g.269611 Transcript_148395/m.269611 type:complete len:551 (-) Transcript_148395:189-1841(-)
MAIAPSDTSGQSSNTGHSHGQAHESSACCSHSDGEHGHSHKSGGDLAHGHANGRGDHGHSHADGHGHSHADGHGHSQADGHGHGHADGHSHGHADAHSHSHAEAAGHGHSHSDGHGVCHADKDGHSLADAHGHSHDAGGHDHGRSHEHGHGHSHDHGGHGHSHGEARHIPLLKIHAVDHWTNEPLATDEFHLADTIRYVRRKVASQTGRNLARLRIVFDSRMLLDRLSLGKAGLRDGTTVSVVEMPLLVVTAHEDGVAGVWNTKDASCMLMLRCHQARVNAAAVSPDGGTFITASDDCLAKLWSTQDGNPFRTLQGHRGGVHSVAFSPDGYCVLTASADKTAKVWQVFQRGRCSLTLEGHGGSVEFATYSDNGSLAATVSVDRSARVWHASKGECLRVLEFTHAAELAPFVFFNLDGTRVITVAKSGMVRCSCWQEGSVDERDVSFESTGATNAIAAAVSPDRGLLGIALADRVEIWYMATPDSDKSCTCKLVLDGHEQLVTSLAFSSDNSLVITSSDDGTAKIWRVEDGMCIQTLNGARGRVRVAALSP